MVWEEGRETRPSYPIDCPDFWSGTSGSPWVKADTNHLVGLIGGYQRGGSRPDYSFSPILTQDAIDLCRTVGRQSVNS